MSAPVPVEIVALISYAVPEAQAVYSGFLGVVEEETASPLKVCVGYQETHFPRPVEIFDILNASGFVNYYSKCCYSYSVALIYIKIIALVRTGNCAGGL